MLDLSIACSLDVGPGAGGTGMGASSPSAKSTAAQQAPSVNARDQVKAQAQVMQHTCAAEGPVTRQTFARRRESRVSEIHTPKERT